MKFRLGIDIGIASVGWGIIDENGNILDAGVRLFPEANSKENSDRRTKRAGRRLLRRRQHRLYRAKQLLLEIGLISNIEYDFYINETTPYELRVKGLTEKLTDRELAISLLHLVKRRGVNFGGSLNDKEDEVEKSKGILNLNNKKIQDRFICEYQLEKLRTPSINEKNGAIRGVENLFNTSDYEKEARKILETQKEYNEKITEEFIEKYIDLIVKRRNYFEGPGRKANGELSPFGWKDTSEWMEKLLGRCTYFPEDEIRMVKNSYTAELFNLLNDLNNLTLKREGNEKVSREEKERLINIYKTQKTINLKNLAKNLGLKEDEVEGYRIDKEGKALFTELKSVNEISKIFEEFSINCDERDIYDEISKILTYYQTEDTKIPNLEIVLKDNFKNLNEETIKNIANRLNKLNYTGSHSLSKKAMNLIIEDLLETNKNQMELYTEMKLVSYKMDFTGMKKIPKNYVEEWILSPVVKRSISQTLNIINEIHKVYGIPEEIVIELPREKNSEDARKRKNDSQKQNEKINKKIREMIENKRTDKSLFEKLKYYDSQNGICMYSLKSIELDNLLSNPENYEIDHIIPRSISFDDSQNNKVLVYRKENQDKGNMSPFEYFKSGKSKISYEQFKAKVLNMKKNKIITSNKKIEYLLLEEDISKYAIKFINRNLVDTSYAAKEILNMLKKFYKDNDESTKVKVLRGSVTAQVRKMWDIKKDRDVSYKHHAIDALVMLSGEKILNSLKQVKTFGKEETYKVDIKTGEILSDDEYRRLFKYDYAEKIKEYKDFKYSHLVDKKPNRKFSKETIYSTRLVESIDKKGNTIQEEYYINKIKDLYNEKNDKVKKFFESEKESQKLLMYHNDRKTFDKLKEIVEEYKKEKNPFAAYYKEHGKYLTKYAKKDNGPPIFEIKYRDSKLGSCLDLTHKYSKVRNKKVVMLSIPSYRADFYSDGKIYKYVKVDYLDLDDKGKYYEINKEKYEKSKAEKNIDKKFEFLFSVYSGDVLKIKYKNDKIEKVKFKGVNNDSRNTLEVALIDKNYGNYIEIIKEIKKILEDNPNADIVEKYNEVAYEKENFITIKNKLSEIPISSKQKMLTIGKDVKEIKKINISALGKERLKLEKIKFKIKK